MARKRKYEAIQGYWVYTIKVPSINKYYVGVSKQQCSDRWVKSKYKDKSLAPYLDEWDSMIKTVLVDNLTKEQAYKYEDNIIQALCMNGLCINSYRSGLISVNDINAYQKQWYEDNIEQKREYQKQRYENDSEYRERKKQQVKQRRLKKKLEKQNQTVVL